MDDAEVQRVLLAHGVCVAYLFGSRADASAGAGADNDHDIGVLFTATPGLAATAVLGEDLAAVLGTAVDVVDLDPATVELRGTVAERGRLLHSSDEPRRVRFEVDARMRWTELRPVVEEATRGYFRRLAERGLRSWSMTTGSDASSARSSTTGPSWPSTTRTPTGAVTWSSSARRSASTWPTTSSPRRDTASPRATRTRSGCSPRSG